MILELSLAGTGGKEGFTKEVQKAKCMGESFPSYQGIQYFKHLKFSTMIKDLRSSSGIVVNVFI